MIFILSLSLSLSLSADSSFRDMSSVNPVGIASSVPVSVPLFPTKPMPTNTEQLSGSVSRRRCVCPCIL